MRATGTKFALAALLLAMPSWAMAQSGGAAAGAAAGGATGAVVGGPVGAAVGAGVGGATGAAADSDQRNVTIERRDAPTTGSTGCTTTTQQRTDVTGDTTTKQRTDC